jgi:hypothetical protein
MTGEIITNELEEPFKNPFQDRANKYKRDRICSATLWVLSNVGAFMLGYYVKTQFNEDDCSIEEDGSL